MENTLNTGFSFDLPKGNSSIIKVIGVGGGGNNALMHMYEKGIHGVDFIICNTDAQTLYNNPVSNKVQLGVSITEGLGAGADPDVGEKAAIESIDDIKAALGQNTKMVFITAGMGGGTGTGAAPIIAKIAKEMGILTVGIVTVPFSFEGRRRLDQAETGLDKLRNNVDSLIVINNDKLRQQFGNLGFKQGFSKADEVLTNAAKGMAEVITAPFTINIDFRDAKSVLQNSGTALMSTGIATGEKRAEEAVRKALDSPLLNDNKITGAKDVLLLIQSGSDEAHEATMDEIGLINDYIQTEAGNTANIIFGVGTDEELGEAIKVLVIATGFAKENPKYAGPTEKIKLSLNDSIDRSNRESPFKTKAERTPGTDTNGDKNLFRLDDEDEVSTPQFRANMVEKVQNTEPEAETQVKYYEEAEDVALGGGQEEYDLFSYGDFEDEKPVSFTFETETPKDVQKKEDFTQDQAMDFSFFVSEPEEKEISFEVQEVAEEPRHYNIPEAAEEPAKEASLEAEAHAMVSQETPKADIDENSGFTFISKTSDADRKIQERRNKLKEFNSRYQVSDAENEFETVPAFRRKNINLQTDNASDQNITSFLSENQRGQMQIRENRFLNKDVD